MFGNPLVHISEMKPASCTQYQPNMEKEHHFPQNLLYSRSAFESPKFTCSKKRRIRCIPLKTFLLSYHVFMCFQVVKYKTVKYSFIYKHLKYLEVRKTFIHLLLHLSHHNSLWHLPHQKNVKFFFMLPK